MATIKKSNTTRIFEDNNFGRFLPILSNENLIEKLIGSKSAAKEYTGINKFLDSKRMPLGEGERVVDPGKIAELLQSISIYGKYTNEIINEIADIKGLDKSFKITYIGHEKYKQVNKSNTDTNIPSFLNKVSMSETVGDDKENPKINNLDAAMSLPYVRDSKHVGLSAFQVVNPEFRGCFKHSQELDLFFNMISTLDMSMAIPYVNAEFLIPDKVKKISNTGTIYSDKSYLTASLNNFILGDDYFKSENQQALYDTNVSDNAKAINGDFYKDIYTTTSNTVKTSSTETQTQIKKSYYRQSLNNAIFFAPQTMVNADYDIANNPNAIVDKFRPFMSITNLSFDVRPTKGLMFYKTATLDLVLYDKARMSQIAPFIKPELLNTVSSEIILEYGWQHNLGDKDYHNPNNLRSVTIGGQEITYLENPIGEFINSLKVREKYIIVNSSYTINQNGTVNINLSLAMKGPAELRGLSFQIDIGVSNLNTKLQDAISSLKNEINKKYTIVTNTGQTDQSQSNKVINKHTSETTESYNSIFSSELQNQLTIQNIDDNDLAKLETILNDPTTQIESAAKENLKRAISEVRVSSAQYTQSINAYFKLNFKFLEDHDADKNDPFVDYDWWNSNLGTIKQSVNAAVHNSTVIENKGVSWDRKRWISLGKLIMSIIGQRLAVESNKYDEIQFVFYNLNGKAIQASFLNIASVPVDKELFQQKLENLIRNAVRLSAEGMLDFILNIAVNQKAAAVYGLGKYYRFTESNSSDLNLDELESVNNSSNNTTYDRKNLINTQNNAVRGEIFQQYYGTNESLLQLPPEIQSVNDITAGLFDLTFKIPRIVMNFDSTYHQNDSNSSILRISIYDDNDNPFESLTELLNNFHNNRHNNAISSITTLRAKIGNIKSAIIDSAKPTVIETTPVNNKKKQNATKQQPVPVVEAKTKEQPNYDNIKSSINADVNKVVNMLISEKLILLKDEEGNEIPVDNKNAPENNSILDNPNIKKILINIKEKDKIKTFQNMKSFFKTMMPSLTFGQSNSALISGNISTQQDAKYSTVLLMKQNGQEAEKEPNSFDFELFSEANSSPMWVIPAQASAQIIGCPLINFSQLIFLDFNTGTSIDNMYFVNGIKHSISPGKFTTDLTLVQQDIYSQFESKATSIAEFIKNIKTWNDTITGLIDDAKKKNAEPKKIVKNQYTPTASDPYTTVGIINTTELSIKINPIVNQRQ